MGDSNFRTVSGYGKTLFYTILWDNKVEKFFQLVLEEGDTQ